jgi:hypothetical protein
MTTTKDGPWEHILKGVGYKLDILSMVITAAQIKQQKDTWKGDANQFEPRLLCYQTNSNDRPAIFKENGLFLIPIKNGSYLITKFNPYYPLDYSYPDTQMVYDLKNDASSLVLRIGNSETSLIDNLRYSGVFERPEILGEKITHGPLLNGRHRCTFDMMLGDQEISIEGTQYEVDTCLESTNNILLIEGKSGKKQIDSFNIRQLYFPYRELYKVCAGKKTIIPVFIHELGGVIHIWKYVFEDYMKMEIKVVGHYMYRFVN